MTENTIGQQNCQQALRLFLNVKPPTSNFREMQQSVELLITLQEENNEITENVQTNRKHELLKKIYDEASITEQQLKQMLKETLCNLNGSNIQSELITEEIDDENFE
ncbi:hypothetical protein I4U23_010886 [Adineta vaga]|nr:hypothetical protein I4U23_010886 [Adineta vaga]